LAISNKIFINECLAFTKWKSEIAQSKEKASLPFKTSPKEPSIGFGKILMDPSQLKAITLNPTKFTPKKSYMPLKITKNSWKFSMVAFIMPTLTSLSNFSMELNSQITPKTGTAKLYMMRAKTTER
jgi:hypothetical protein